MYNDFYGLKKKVRKETLTGSTAVQHNNNNNNNNKNIFRPEDYGPQVAIHFINETEIQSVSRPAKSRLFFITLLMMKLS